MDSLDSLKEVNLYFQLDTVASIYKGDLFFDWTIVDVTDNALIFDVNFTVPESVSVSSWGPDELVLIFTDKEQAIQCEYDPKLDKKFQEIFSMLDNN